MSHILGRLRQLSACSTLSRMARVALSRHGQAALIPVGVSHTVKRLQPSMQMRYTSSTTNTMQDQPPGIGFMLNLGAGKVQMNHHWLRDHCRCDQCYNHNTSQKNILPHHIQPDIQPQNWQVTEQTLNVTWQDGHQSAYKLSWLQDNYHPATSQVTQQQLWDADTIKQHNVTPTQYEDYLMTEDNTGIKHLLNNLLVYGFGIVQGVPVSIEATQKVVEHMCHIDVTLFGKMWSFTANEARDDTSYTNLALGAHNDTSYLSIPMGVQVFHCVAHDGGGGETLLLDGFNAASLLRQQDPHSFDMLCKHELEHEYKEKGSKPHHLRSLDTILKVHPVSGHLEWIRYNHYDRAPIRTVEPYQLPPLYSALAALSAHIENPHSEHWLKLHPGMVLFVDNWRVLHGRSAFTGHRRMCGCYLPHDDWTSRARTLGLIS